MDGRMVLFMSGIGLILALFVPMSMLQDSAPQPSRKKWALKGAASRCPEFETPQIPVGRFECESRHIGLVNEMKTCWLECPAGMVVRPSAKPRILYRCLKGKWNIVKDPELYCAALSPVLLVKQQMASPELLNSLLHKYLNHSHGYLAMAFFFDRADVQLPGFHKFFLGMSEKSMSMARDIMSYINKRGGWIDLPELPRPMLAEKMHVGHTAGHAGLTGMRTALDMEREAQQLALDIIDKVEKIKMDDPHLLHVLQDQHLAYKVTVIKDLMDYITQLTAFQLSEDGDYVLGEYQMDLSLQ